RDRGEGDRARRGPALESSYGRLTEDRRHQLRLHLGHVRLRAQPGPPQVHRGVRVRWALREGVPEVHARDGGRVSEQPPEDGKGNGASESAALTEAELTEVDRILRVFTGS